MENTLVQLVRRYRHIFLISLDLLFKDMIKLEEEIAENMEHPSLIENTNEVADFHPPIANSLDAESTTPRFTKSIPKKIKDVKLEPKEEPNDETETIAADNHISGPDSGDFIGDEMLNDDMGHRMEDVVNEINENSLNMEVESTRLVVGDGRG
ncbi:hypothetical protein PENTCL1PPCAC_24714, partial [Pristionchus entomophagus]